MSSGQPKNEYLGQCVPLGRALLLILSVDLGCLVLVTIQPLEATGRSSPEEVDFNGKLGGGRCHGVGAGGACYLLCQSGSFEKQMSNGIRCAADILGQVLWSIREEQVMGRWEGPRLQCSSEQVSARPLGSPSAKMASWRRPVQGRMARLQSPGCAPRLAGSCQERAWSWQECCRRSAGEGWPLSSQCLSAKGGPSTALLGRPRPAFPQWLPAASLLLLNAHPCAPG